MTRIFLSVLLLIGVAACGDGNSASRGSDIEASPGVKGPGPVDRGSGKGEGSMVGEGQNRDAGSSAGGTTSSR